MLKINNIGRIYCIKSSKTNKIYIGSTFKSLSERLSSHKNDYRKYLNGKKRYTTAYEIMEHGDFYIELIEQHENLNKTQLEKIEGDHIKNNKCVNILKNYGITTENQKLKLKEQRKILREFKNNIQKEDEIKNYQKLDNCFEFTLNKKDRLSNKEIAEVIKKIDLKNINSSKLKMFFNKNGSNAFKSNGIRGYEGIKIKSKQLNN
jgi:hypothetical protein